MSQRYGAAPHATLTWKDANGNIQQATDVRQVQIYTTVQLNNGDSGDLRAFSQGISSQIPGGTRNLQEDDTNLSKAATNGLDRDTVMDVYQIGLHIERVMRPGADGKVVKQDSGTARSNLPTVKTTFDVYRGGFIKFYNAEKLQTQGKFAMYPAGQGLTGFSNLSGQEVVTSGMPSPQHRQAMLVPTQLKDGVGFWVDTKTSIPYVINQEADDVLAEGANLTSLDFVVSFYGIGNKPVN
jgi:hypothetical protein